MSCNSWADRCPSPGTQVVTTCVVVLLVGESELRPLLARKGCGREDDSGKEAYRRGTDVAGADRCGVACVYRQRKVPSPCIGHCLAADCPPCPTTVACSEAHRAVTKPQMEQCEGAPIHLATLGKRLLIELGRVDVARCCRRQRNPR